LFTFVISALFPRLLAIAAKPGIPKKKHIRCFSRINIDELRYDAKALSFDAIKDTNDVNVKISLFNEEVSSLFNQHTPLKSVTSKRAKPEWLTHNISEMIKTRRKAYNAFNRTRAQEKWRFYVNIRNEVSKAVQREKKALRNINWTNAVMPSRCGMG
jgi:hypothetical protein